MRGNDRSRIRVVLASTRRVAALTDSGVRFRREETVRVVFAAGLVVAMSCVSVDAADAGATSFRTVDVNPTPAFCEDPRGPSSVVYIPNVTKTLGGPGGWTTPFIIQNIGTTSTDVEVRFLPFDSGTPIACRNITALAPGASFADIPSNDADLPENRQFSVLVRAFASDVVAVVNQQAGSGASQEGDAYVGASVGSTTVFLPNIVRRFFGFHTPIIIQSVYVDPGGPTSGGSTVVTARFVSFDGTMTATITRTLCCGQSQFIEPNLEPALSDGTQYAVTLTATHPISVLVNTHRDQGVTTPVMYSVSGIAGDAGATTLYGPYAAKNAPGVGRGSSTIVVQNMGSASASPTLMFSGLGGGSSTTISGPPTGPGRSWVFDPRYTGGDTAKAVCGATASPGCLADGEYSFVAQSSGAIAAQVNVIWESGGGEPQTAAGYTAVARPSAKVYLPNVTRTLGGATGWTTPFIVQSAAATNVKVSWYRFSDGALVTTQNFALAASSAQRIDPRSVPGLSDDTQYSVVLDGGTQNIAAIVTELNYSGGDGAMIYTGFSPCGAGCRP